ncbi:MAG: squalene/phytoene synthase family protein [Rhodospirillales bacterium]|nr:squalene/phytoene synthase family protein [Rhodospirillales bacterium]
MPQISYVAEQVRRHDNDRFICSLFAAPAARTGLHAVHAFNIEVARTRELVREPVLGLMRLQWWRDAIAAIAAGRPPDHPVAAPLADAMARFDLDREDFARLLDTRALDFEDEPLADMTALVAYADGTSATLAHLSLQVVGVDSAADPAAAEAARAAARDVAVAWSLVGLVRAVPFHARARRCYLPAAVCRDAGLDVATLFDRGPTRGLPAAAEAVATVARQYLQAARGRMDLVPKAALPVLLPATIADLYLQRLQAAGFDPFAPLVQHAGAGRLLRAAFAALRGRY